MSVFSKIKNWLTGTNKKYQASTATSKKYYSKVGNTSNASSMKKALNKQKQEEEAKRKQLQEAFKAKETKIQTKAQQSGYSGNSGADKVLKKIQQKTAQAPKSITDTKGIKVSNNILQKKSDYTTNGKYDAAKSIIKGNENSPVMSAALRGGVEGGSLGVSELLYKNARPDIAQALKSQEDNYTTAQKWANVGGNLAGSMLSFGMTSGLGRNVGGKIVNASPKAKSLIEGLSNSKAVTKWAVRNGKSIADLSAKVEAELVKDLGLHLTSENVQSIAQAIGAYQEKDGTFLDKIMAGTGTYALSQGVNTLINGAMDVSPAAVRLAAKKLKTPTTYKTNLTKSELAYKSRLVRNLEKYISEMETKLAKEADTTKAATISKDIATAKKMLADESSLFADTAGKVELKGTRNKDVVIQPEKKLSETEQINNLLKQQQEKEARRQALRDRMWTISGSKATKKKTREPMIEESRKLTQELKDIEEQLKPFNRKNELLDDIAEYEDSLKHLEKNKKSRRHTGSKKDYKAELRAKLAEAKSELKSIEDGTWADTKNAPIEIKPKNATQEALQASPTTKIDLPTSNNTNARIKPLVSNTDNSNVSVNEINGKGFMGVDEDLPIQNTAKNIPALKQTTAKTSFKPLKGGKNVLENIHSAQKEAGIDSALLNTARQQDAPSAEIGQEIMDAASRRTADVHNKKGFGTIATAMGDEPQMGSVKKMIDDGEISIKVYKDKENYAAGTKRVVEKIENGEVGGLIEIFSSYADGKTRLNTKEQRDLIYDVFASIDIANANKNEQWSEKLFLSACKAGAEQVSVGGLTGRQWHLMAMSSPTYRTKAVKNDFLRIFNNNKGVRDIAKNYLGIDGKLKSIDDFDINKIDKSKLDSLYKEYPDLKETFGNFRKALDDIETAKSKDEVEELSERALLEARKMLPLSAFDQLTQWRYSSMLSNIKTHMKNAANNIYGATLGQYRDHLAKGIEDNLVKKGKLDGVEGYLKSTDKMNLKANIDSKKGIIENLKVRNAVSNAKKELSDAKFELSKAGDGASEELKANVETLAKKLAETEQTAKETIEKNMPERLAGRKAKEAYYGTSAKDLVSEAMKFENKFIEGTAKGKIGKGISKFSEFVGGALETSDAISVERVYCEAYDKVLTGNNYETLVKKLEDESLDEATRNAIKLEIKRIEDYATQVASYKAAHDLFRNYSELSSALNKFVRNTLYNQDANKVMKSLGFIVHAQMPFARAVVNITKRGFDYSPVGLIKGKIELEKAIKLGDTTAINDAVEKMAEGKIGTEVALLGAGLGFLDPDGMIITGKLDTSDPEDKNKKDAGYQDYSVTIGNRNFTLDFATQTSGSFFVGREVGSILRNVIDDAYNGEPLDFDIETIVHSLKVITSSVVEPAMNLGMFQGVNYTLENAISSQKYDDTVMPALKILDYTVNNYLISMIPNILGAVSRTLSPYDYFINGKTDLGYRATVVASKIPIASNYILGAKTNGYGEIVNPKTQLDVMNLNGSDLMKRAGETALSAGKNIVVPTNISNVTYDSVDKELVRLSKSSGNTNLIPKVFRDESITIGKTEDNQQTLDLKYKDIADYNVAKGTSGYDSARAILETVPFNRYKKDANGKKQLVFQYSEEEKEEIAKGFDGKSPREVANWVFSTKQYKNASDAEQKQIVRMLFGLPSALESEDDTVWGSTRTAERAIAKKNGISNDEYNYYNEVPKRIQKNLQASIDNGVVTYKQAVDFIRHAGKTYYTTDEDGEKGGTRAVYYNKGEMYDYIKSSGLPSETASALFNACKKDGSSGYGSSSSGGGWGYRRGGGSSGKKISNAKASAYNVKTFNPKAKTSSSKSKKSASALDQALENMNANAKKITPPKNK